MNRAQIILAIVAIAVVSGFSGYYLQRLTTDNTNSKEVVNEKKSPSPEEVIGTDAVELSLLDLNGERRYL